MDGRQKTVDAINHIRGPVPQLVGFTQESRDKYGEGITRRYSTREVRALQGAGAIDGDVAFSLACGNDVIAVQPPWWQWDDPDGEHRRAETPGTLPKAYGTGGYGQFFELCGRLRQTGRYILACIYGSHFEKAYFARGFENFLADIAGEPGYAKRLLGYIIEKNLVMLENFIYKADVDGVLLGSDWGSQRGLLMSPAVWREMIKQNELREYELLRGAGKHVWVHSCGDIQDILPDLCEMGVDVLNPVQPECMDLARVKGLYGGRLAFWGGIGTQRVLPYGAPDEVRAETRKVIGLMANGGGYIAAPSQDIQDDVPAENIYAMLDTIKEYS